MVTSISSASSIPANRGTGGIGTSIALRGNLSRCERQLGDWEACPSRKTPEGKKIIQDLQTQIRELESKINSASDANMRPQQSSVTASIQAPGAMLIHSTESNRQGRYVDVFA